MLCFLTALITCVWGAAVPQTYRLVADRDYNDGNGNYVRSLRAHLIGKRSAIKTVERNYNDGRGNFVMSSTGDDQPSNTILDTRHLIGKRSGTKITDRSYNDGQGNFVSSSWTAMSRPGLINHLIG